MKKFNNVDSLTTSAGRKLDLMSCTQHIHQQELPEDETEEVRPHSCTLSLRNPDWEIIILFIWSREQKVNCNF